MVLKMNYRELYVKLFSDECFRNFCSMIDDLRNTEHKIKMPFETAILLFDANVDYIEEINDIEVIHTQVKNFLNPNGRTISKDTLFYDYFVIKNIMRIADGNIKQLEDNRFSHIPLDFTDYANSICKFDTCTCGHKPKIIFSNFINSLTGKVMCEKCGLSVSKLFIYDKLFLKQCKDYGEVYVNLEKGIKELSDSWNKNVAKNESILHRTMREVLSYDSNVCVNKIIYDLHKKLYSYMVDNNIYRKPKYWNEPGFWDIATDKMMECKEPVKWVEDYLWENMPNRIEV